ncbi:MAG: alpha/beta fold hydrolase [Parahaliea sp.]
MRGTYRGHIELAHQEFGFKKKPPILLIMGLGAQMVQWPDVFCEELASRGFRVIRFDNRDVGESTWLDSCSAPSLIRLTVLRRLGFACSVPYTLEDMADDAIGLLDTLGIPEAHVVGASMGGMIGQLMAIYHPERVLSLTSIMSSTGNPCLPRAARELTRKIIMPSPDVNDFEACVQHAMRINKLLMSPAYPSTDEQLRERVEQVVSRGVNPAGKLRQIAAIMVADDRRCGLARLRIPSAVIHGNADRLVPVAHGLDIASVTPEAELELIDGMAHDLPTALVPRMVDIIERTARRRTIMRAAG